MKVDIRDLTLKLRGGEVVNVNKSALESDMKVVYDYYDGDPPKFMEKYYKTHNNFSLIPFTSHYLGNLIGIPINIAVKNDVITLYS